MALAIHGTYDKAAASLGKTHRAFVSQLSRARKQFLQLWHEGEQPSRIWGTTVSELRDTTEKRTSLPSLSASASAGQGRGHLIVETDSQVTGI
jgi:hypothetical protein